MGPENDPESSACALAQYDGSLKGWGALWQARANGEDLGQRAGFSSGG